MAYEFRPRGAGHFDAFLKTPCGTVRLGTVSGRAGQWNAEPPRATGLGPFRTKSLAADALQAVKFPREVAA
jgi:hypothetical protein